MKKLITYAVWGFLSVSAAFAETVTAKIPFDFYVQGNLYPAGRYEVSREGEVMLKLRNRDKVLTVMSIAGPGAIDKGPSRLEFEQYGDRIALRRYWNARTQRGVSIPAPKFVRDWLRSGHAVETITTVSD